MNLSRRTVIQSGACVGGGLLIATSSPAAAAVETTGVFVANTFLKVDLKGVVTLTMARVEMGQGTATSAVQLVAEELDVEPASIQLELAPADRAYDNPSMGFQMTGGSSSTSSAFDPLRMAGAQAREMLKAAAAKTWGVPKKELTTDNGHVTHRKTGQRISYGILAQSAGSFSAGKITLKAPPFRYIGQPLPRVDAKLKVDGSAKFGIDVDLPNALTAVLIRPPVFGATLKRFDATLASRSTGVSQVVAAASGVAIVAQSYWHARNASKHLTVEWNLPDFARFDSATLPDEHQKHVEQARTVSTRGNAEAALRNASVHSAQYFAPFLAHATMEPQNATAWVKEDSCEVWAPTQGPGVARAQLADALGLSASKITVHQTWVGGGFGRRIPQDYVVEAALVSKAIGKPVKLVWSREDDMKNSMYRPAASHFVTGALDEKGRPSAWRHTVVTQSLILQIADAFIGTQFAQMPRFLRNLTASFGKSLLVPKDQTSVEGVDSLPYEIQNHEVRLAHHECGVPIGFWRSVGHSHSAFATESFIDELAHLAKADPFEFRKALLQRKHRHRWVLELAAEKAGWSTPPPPGRARGIAVHSSFGSYAAAVAEVSVPQAKIRVHKIVMAIDCGTVVNPNLVEAQMESAAIFGLTATLKGQIDYVKGAVQQSNFHDYELLRMHEAPAVEVYLRPNQAKATGAGEPGVPVIAPAVANAVFALTGQRLRRLPLRLT